MRREYIRATTSWHKGPCRFDCAFLNRDPDIPGFRGLDVVRILLFFSFSFQGVVYPCALVRWFTVAGDGPDEDTGMWIVRPSDDQGDSEISVIHLDCVVRAAHLVAVFDHNFLPKDFLSHCYLDAFNAYYVNKYIDHHSFRNIT